MPQAKTQPEEFSSQNARVSYGTASLTLRAFYSSSRSSVRIQPVQAVLPCGDVQQVTVNYHLLATELGDGAARAEFYHLVSAGQHRQRGQLCNGFVLAQGPLLAQISPLLCSFPFRFWPEDPLCIMAKQEYFLIHK